MNSPAHIALSAQAMLNRLTRERLLPIIRAKTPEDAHWTALQVFRSGLEVVEITWTVPDTAEVIERLRREKPDAVIGAGTVLTIAQAEKSLAAGADFLVSPVLDPMLIQLGIAHEVLMLPGAMTPTEMVRAVSCGARAVKFFPAETAGGPAFIRAIRSLELPVQIVPTGGVHLEHVAGYWEAGCPAVGVGGPMLPEALIQSRDESGLHQRIEAFLARREECFPGQERFCP